MEKEQIEYLMREIEKTDVLGATLVPQIKNRDLHHLCALALTGLKGDHPQPMTPFSYGMVWATKTEQPTRVEVVTGKYLYDVTLVNREEYTIECDGYSSQDDSIVFFLSREGIGDVTVAIFPLHSIEKLVRVNYQENVRPTLRRPV